MDTKIAGNFITKRRPKGIPKTAPITNRINTGLSTSRHPETTVNKATVRPASPIRDIEVCRSTDNNASKGMLTTASPKPKVARMRAPINTTATMRDTSVIDISFNIATI